MAPVTAFFLGVVSTVVTLIVFWLLLRALKPWIAARFAGVNLGFGQFVGMRLRNTDPNVIVGALVILAKRGESIDPLHLEATYLSLSDDQRTIPGLVDAVRAKLAK